MPTLQDTFYLSRSGIYSNPQNTNDPLPVVYGDLTDGVNGNWKLPCINKSTFVYCYAAHVVESVAQGNSINIYNNGVLVDPANYTFSYSNAYEAGPTISTITFTSDQGNATISARGKGLYYGLLLENIVDIINNFLTAQNSFTYSLFDSTSNNTAKSLFYAQSYKAAGVICADAPIWDTIQKMMASFYGAAYLNGSKALVLAIDDGTVPSSQAAIIPKSDLGSVTATQRAINLINCCPASYAFDYVGNSFRSHSTGLSTQDAASQTLFGIQQPEQPYSMYWCRDSATVTKIQTILVKKFKYPVWELEIEDIRLKRSNIDVGDLVVATIDRLFDLTGAELDNEIWKVVGVKPIFSDRKIAFRLIDTGGYLTASGARDTTVY